MVSFVKTENMLVKNGIKNILRGVQCILLSTHGVVGPKKKFFEKAFGKDVKNF